MWLRTESSACRRTTPVRSAFSRKFRNDLYYGKRDNGYHEDKLTRRLDLNIMPAMMVARSLAASAPLTKGDRGDGETGTRVRSPLSDSRGGKASGNSVKASTGKGKNRTVI